MQLTELPPELLPTILSHCSRTTLAGVLRVNHYFHDAAIRVLYSTIPRLSVSTSTKCFTSLCFNDEACKFVRTLTVQWDGVFLKDEIPGHGTLRNVARFGVKRAVLSRKLLQSRLFLLRTLLKQTTNLVSLTLIVSSRDSQSDAYASAILSAKAPTSLLYFKTSFFVTVGVAAFIERQRDLKEFHLDSGAAFIEDVVVHPDACPKLERFSLSWRNQRQSVEAFIRGRPLEHFAVILSQRNALDVIATLGKAVPTLPSVVFTLRDPLEEDFLEYATTHLPELLQIKLSLPTLPPKVILISLLLFLIASLN
ncbi:hypothetical protein ONZ45_g13756 [Pleurotus djamor]|nr:hypothetical protein ONZ45_g13756 [Pleurotus djamor]